MDYAVLGIPQARILEWVVFPFSRGSFQDRDQTQVSCIARGFFTSWATREALVVLKLSQSTKGWGEGIGKWEEIYWLQELDMTDQQ